MSQEKGEKIFKDKKLFKVAPCPGFTRMRRRSRSRSRERGRRSRSRSISRERRSCRSRSRERIRNRSRSRSRSRSTSRPRRDDRHYRSEASRRSADDSPPRRSRHRTPSPEGRSRHPSSNCSAQASKSSKTANIRWDDPARLFVEDYKPSAKEIPKFRAPPNRFNLQPGPEWDGVDRSNGFELKYFKKKASETVKKELDYQYTVADM